MYKINDTDITTYGILPSPSSPGDLALSGALDFPKRLGTTEYNWGNETEAFVDAEDIEFDGRNLTFRGFLKAADRITFLAKVEAFKTACIACTIFSTPLGDFPVILKDEIKVTEYLNSNVAIITVEFWQENITFGSAGTSSGGIGYKLAGYNLKNDFGIVVEKRANDLDVAKRIEVKTTGLYTQTEHRGPRDIQLNCTMISDNLTGLVTNMNKFHALLASEGMKTLAFPDGKTHEVYIKDGFQAQIKGNRIAKFYFKLREV